MFVWTKLSDSKWMDAWEERFAKSPNLAIELLKGGKTIRVQLFCHSEAEAETVKSQFGGSIRKVADAEWINREVALPRPTKVRDKLLVTAESNPQKLADLQREFPKRQIISIPAELAFGTGDHATTSTCLRQIVDISHERKNTNWSVADLGTGTGLLAIAAKKLGAAATYACDFDPMAVRVANANFSRNGVESIVAVEQDVLQWTPPKNGYDLVLANLFSTVLLEAWPVIARSIAPQGDIVVSGILASQAWDVFLGAAANGIGFPTIIRKGKWVTARGKLMNDLT